MLMSNKWQGKAIRKHHIEQAAKMWDEGERRNFKDSTKFDVMIGRRAYPPKAISAFALELATGQIIKPDDFKGAAGGYWHSILSQYFPIRPKSNESDTDLPKRMQAFFSSLRDIGFKVDATPFTKRDSQKRTLRIYWSGVYVGQWTPTMWTAKDQRVLLYRFPAPGNKTINEAPATLTTTEFADRHNVDVAHLKLHKDGGKQYLHVRSEETALVLLQEWANRIDGAKNPLLQGTGEQVASDIHQIQADPALTETERQTLIDARVGQGKFRSGLMREFNNRCAVSGLDVIAALRASHIVPWSDATNEERLNPKNGLLLAANLDALFDRYLISFDDEGQLIASPALTEDQRVKLRLDDCRVIELCEKRKAFLQQHMAEFQRRAEASDV